MMNRVVVMGGSFNPPTLAHLRLMEAALNAIDACQGIFVPTAHPKTIKQTWKTFTSSVKDGRVRKPWASPSIAV